MFSISPNIRINWWLKLEFLIFPTKKNNSRSCYFLYGFYCTSKEDLEKGNSKYKLNTGHLDCSAEDVEI